MVPWSPSLVVEGRWGEVGREGGGGGRGGRGEGGGEKVCWRKEGEGIRVMTNFCLISVFLTFSHVDYITSCAQYLRLYIISSLFLHQFLYLAPVGAAGLIVLSTICSHQPFVSLISTYYHFFLEIVAN